MMMYATKQHLSNHDLSPDNNSESDSSIVKKPYLGYYHYSNGGGTYSAVKHEQEYTTTKGSNRLSVESHRSFSNHHRSVHTYESVLKNGSTPMNESLSKSSTDSTESTSKIGPGPRGPNRRNRRLSMEAHQHSPSGLEPKSNGSVNEQKNRNLNRIKSRERRAGDHKLSKTRSRDGKSNQSGHSTRRRDKELDENDPKNVTGIYNHRDSKHLDDNDSKFGPRVRRDSNLDEIDPKSLNGTKNYRQDRRNSLKLNNTFKDSIDFEGSNFRLKNRDGRYSLNNDEKFPPRRDSASTVQSDRSLNKIRSRDRRDHNRDGVGRRIIKIRSRDSHFADSYVPEGKNIKNSIYDSASDKGSSYVARSRRSSRSTLRDSSSKLPKSAHSIAYPPGIKYRPGRIQTLTGSQEVALKQTWAILCKSWGYPLNMSVEDTKHEESFIASSISAKLDNYVNPLERTSTRASLFSSASTKSRNSIKRFWSRRSGEQNKYDNWASSSQRMKDLSVRSNQERYEPSVFPSKDIINVFVNHYQLSFEYSDDYISSGEEYSEFDADSDDNSSIKTFVTANSEFSEITKFEKPTKLFSDSRKLKSLHKTKSAPSEAVFSTLYHIGVVPKTPIDVQESSYPMTTDCSPKEIQHALLKVMRNDLLDNFVLRFLRARKWNVNNCIQMLYNSANWRQNFPADRWLMEADGPSYLKQLNKGLIKNFTAEKAWIYGRDRDNNVLFWFQAQKHFGTDASAYETQRYALLCVEWVRLFLQDYHESADTCTIVFDLTGFTLKNADYTAIKFLADIFEAHYPECLGKVLVHNAPWVFSTVWSIIKHWLDPVVAAKIFFTKSHELPNFINPCYIPIYLGGNDTTNSTSPLYPHPKKGDDHPPKRKDSTYRQLRKTRDDLLMRYIDCTRKWIESTNPEISSLYLEEKIALNLELVNNYIDLDPYIRNPGVYDRNGLLRLTK